MYSLISRLLPLCVLMLLVACLETKRDTVKLYPLDSLIRAQAHLLTDSKARLEKKAEIDGVVEQVSITPNDTTAWLHELDMFSALNSINMPTHLGEYEVQDGVADKKSNLTIRSFITTKSLPVVYLKLFYHEKLNKLRRIEALYHEENALLKGSRHLTMEFRDIYDKTTLTAYVVEGSQEMFLHDNVKFSVRASIKFP